MALDRTDLRFASLCLAMIFYAIWGSPTPDNPGRLEFVIGALLVLAVGPSEVVRLMSFHSGHELLWQRAGQALLFYSVSVPVLLAIFFGNGIGNMLRDIFPFLFFMMPLFLDRLVCRRPHYLRILAGCAVFVGLMFAWRSLVPDLGPEGVRLFGRAVPQDFLYLTNAPTVLFAALLLLGLSFNRLAGPPRCLMFAAAALLISILPLMAMASVIQRASIAYVVLALLYLSVHLFITRPYRLLLPALAFLCFALALSPLIGEWLQLAGAKTAAVGQNMRLQEAAAVIDTLDDGLFTALFGRGWGATFASPAVGGVTVNFTHSLITAVWLKTGLVGLLLSAVYLAGLVVGIVRLIVLHPVWGLALAGPVAINVFLYASYKSLDFGLVLLLAAAAAPQALKASATLHPGRGYCIEGRL